METRRVDADTVKELVEHLFADARATPAVHKLVSTDLKISISAAPGQLAFLGPASGHNAGTLLGSFKVAAQAAEAIDLKWAARFVRVEESSLETRSASDSQGVGISESWTAHIEWQLVYEPPPSSGGRAGKRFKLWTSSTRAIELVFATRNSDPATSTTHAHSETQSPLEFGVQAARVEQTGLELVAVDYSLGATLPFPLSWIDAALPRIVKHSILAVQTRLLFAGLRLFVTICDPERLEPSAPIASHLPDPEAPAPPVHLRHHQRHYEPELQAEPRPSLSPFEHELHEPSHHYHRRRWSASTPQHATPATTSAAARLHLERPLAERHLHPSSAHGDAPRHREPAHAHPLPSSSGLARRDHVHAHQPGHPHDHHHRHHHANTGQHHHGHRHGLLYRFLKFPLELVALLVQVVQIIFFDFAAVGDFFGRMVEALLATFVIPGGNKGLPARVVELEAESLLEAGHSRRVSFADSVSSEPEPMPLNPPPSPHLAPIAEEGTSSTTPPKGGALESSYPHTVASHGHLVSSSLIASLPIPIDVDAHALALHEQLANEAAAQGHFRAELEVSGLITPPKVVPVSERDVEVHREVAKEVARVAGSMEHVERMAERFAPGGPELQEFVEQVGGDSTRSRTLEEHSASAEAKQVVLGQQEVAEPSPLEAHFALDPHTAISPDRPGLRKASSAPPSSSKASPGQQTETAAPSNDDPLSSSRAAEKLALQARLGLIEPSSTLQQVFDPAAGQPEASTPLSAEGLLQAIAGSPPSELRRTSVGSITIGSLVGEALPRAFDDDDDDDVMDVVSASAPRMDVPLTSTPPPAAPEPTASAVSATATSIPFLPSVPFKDLPIGTPPERPATAATTVQDPLMVMHGLGLGPEWRAKLSSSSSPGSGGVGLVGGLSEAGESGMMWPYRQPQAGGVASVKAGEGEQEQQQQQERSVDPPVRLVHSADPASRGSKLASPAMPAGMVRSMSYSPATATLSPPSSSSAVSPVFARSSSDTGTVATAIDAATAAEVAAKPSASPSSTSDPLSGSPSSLRMQHELSTSGPFTSSQGRRSTSASSPPSIATGAGFAVEVAEGESGSSMGLAMSTRTPSMAAPAIHPAHGYNEQVEEALGSATVTSTLSSSREQDAPTSTSLGGSSGTASEQQQQQQSEDAPTTLSQGNGERKSAGRGGGGRSGHKKKKNSKGKVTR